MTAAEKAAAAAAKKEAAAEKAANSKKAASQALASAINGIVNEPKSDVVDQLKIAVDTYATVRPDKVADQEVMSQTFVFTIGPVSPKQEAWMLPFVHQVAHLFGCDASVTQVVKGIATFVIHGHESDLRIASRISNAVITRTHHDAWKSANSKKSDVPCATRRERFCNARLDMIMTLTSTIVTGAEVHAYARSADAAKAEVKSA